MPFLAADTDARVIAIGPPSSRTDCFPDPMSWSTLYTAPAFVHVILRPSVTPESKLIDSLRDGSCGPAPILPIVRTAPVTGSVSGAAAALHDECDRPIRRRHDAIDHVAPRADRRSRRAHDRVAARETGARCGI